MNGPNAGDLRGTDGRRRAAIVTGGSGGIGLACGRLLHQKGYGVVLTSRRAEPLAAAAEGIGARWVAADSADVESFAQVVAAVETVDLLVHAAGAMTGTFVRKETVDSFDSLIRTNLRSAFVVAQATLPVMVPGSRFVFISSSAAHAPQPGKAAYSASKAGLNAFVTALAREVDRDGIAVHLVTPAPVATPMLDDVHFPMVPLDADDVAAVVAWLDGLHPSIVLPEVEMSAVDKGPFASEPFVPAAARAVGRTGLMAPGD